MQEMQHWYESEEYQLEMAQRQLDFDEKNMSSFAQNIAIAMHRDLKCSDHVVVCLLSVLFWM